MSKTGISATTTAGLKGQFDVVANGELLFSKDSEGRFPDQDEILSQLA